MNRVLIIIPLVLASCVQPPTSQQRLLAYEYQKAQQRANEEANAQANEQRALQQQKADEQRAAEEQVLAEQANNNYCRDPSMIRTIMSHFPQVVDMSHITTTGDGVCRFVAEFSDTHKQWVIVQFRKNVLGEPMIRMFPTK